MSAGALYRLAKTIKLLVRMVSPLKSTAFFVNLIGSFMVNSFNYVFQNGTALSISQHQGRFTKQKDIPEVAVFLDFEKAFDSIECNFIHKCLETFNLALAFESG